MAAARPGRRRIPTDWLSGLASRSFLLYSLFTLVLFVIFLIANFPHDVIIRSALEGVEIRPLDLFVGNARFAWWRGYELQDVRVMIDPEMLDGAAPEEALPPPVVASRSIHVAPGIAGLLQGRISSVQARARMYNGRIDVRWTAGDGADRLTIEADELQIARYPWLIMLLDEGGLTGALRGVITAEARDSRFLEGQAAGELELLEGSLQSAVVMGIQAPDLHNCTGTAKLDMESRRIEIAGVRLSCDELEIDVGGQIVLRDRLPESIINLRLAANAGTRPSPEADIVRQLIPESITGTFARPRFTGAGRR